MKKTQTLIAAAFALALVGCADDGKSTDGFGTINVAGDYTNNSVSITSGEDTDGAVTTNDSDSTIAAAPEGESEGETEYTEDDPTCSVESREEGSC